MLYDMQSMQFCTVHQFKSQQLYLTKETARDLEYAILAATIESSDDAIFSKTLDGCILSWNAGAERLYGYRVQEILGQTVHVLVPAERRQELEKIMRQVKAGQQIDHFETTRIRKDGSMVEVSITISPIKDATGKIIAASTIARDITERKQMQEKLHASEQRFRALIEKSADAMALFDLTGHVLYANSSITRLLGYTPEKLIGRNILELIHPSEHEGAKEVMAQIVQQMRVNTIVENRLRHHDGSWRWIEVSITDLFTEPDVQAIVCTCRDVTQRKQAEEQLLFNVHVTSSISDAVIVTDLDLCIQSWNDAAETLYGWTREEVLGKHAGILLDTEFFGSSREESRTEVLMKGMWKGEVVQHRKDGTPVPILTAVALVKDRAGTVLGIVAVNRDITERKEAEQRKDDFVSMASHELKTPLTSLLAYTQLLRMKSEKKADTETGSYLAKMETQVKKLNSLIADFLDVTKMQAGKLLLNKEVITVDDFVHEVVENLQYITPQHQLLIEGAVKREILADRNHLGQVLTNLLSNAVKYSPQADKVIVKVAQSQGQLMIGVQDFGIGISRQHQQKVFERFYRVFGNQEKCFPGLGIGLYVSSQIIELHKGKIWVESEEGKGSTFSFCLPLLEQGA